MTNDYMLKKCCERKESCCVDRLMAIFAVKKPVQRVCVFKNKPTYVGCCRYFYKLFFAIIEVF